MSLGVSDTHQRLESITAWRNPTRKDVVIRTEDILVSLDINVVEVKNNQSAVRDELVILTGSKLTRE
jgi:hypothetical protein